MISDITVWHSAAYPSENGAFKAAVLQLIAWLAKTTILAWNLLWKYISFSGHVHRPDVQICRARFVGKGRVKAARRFWVDKMLRSARDLANLNMHEQFAGLFESQPCLPFVCKGGGRKPSARKRKAQIMFDGLCKLLQAVSDEPDSESKQVPGDRLLASLQSIVHHAQVNGTSGLIQKVRLSWLRLSRSPASKTLA